MLYNIEGPFRPLQGGTSTRQVAVATDDKIDRSRGGGGDMGFGHANCVEVVATKGPLKYP